MRIWLSVACVALLTGSLWAEGGNYTYECLKLSDIRGCDGWENFNWQDCNLAPEQDTDASGELYLWCDPDWFIVEGDDFNEDFDQYESEAGGDEPSDDGRVGYFDLEDYRECAAEGECMIDEEEDEFGNMVTGCYHSWDDYHDQYPGRVTANTCEYEPYDPFEGMEEEDPFGDPFADPI